MYYFTDRGFVVNNLAGLREIRSPQVIDSRYFSGSIRKIFYSGSLRFRMGKRKPESGLEAGKPNQELARSHLHAARTGRVARNPLVERFGDLLAVAVAAQLLLVRG